MNKKDHFNLEKFVKTFQLKRKTNFELTIDASKK